MKNYVISLSHEIKRREHITNEFGKHGINFEFFDAITPATADTEASRLKLALMGSKQLFPAEKACFLSHVALWQKILDEDIAYIAIFEDDIYLGEDANRYFNHDNWLQSTPIQLLKTETCLQHRKLSANGIDLPCGRHAYQMQEFHLGMGGYILSQDLARQLIHALQSFRAEEFTRIDNWLFGDLIAEKNINAYQMLPAICIQEVIRYPNQDSMPSSLTDARANRKARAPKRSLWQKIQGELSNAWRKTVGRTHRTYIDFK